MNNEIINKINILLDEEVRSYAAKGRQSGSLGSLNIGLQSMPNNGWTSQGEIPRLLFDESSADVISSPNATILLKLYGTLDPTSQKKFKEHLISQLDKNSNYSSIGYFIFFVLYRLGHHIKALEKARYNLSGDVNFGYSNLLGAFSMIVSREYLEIEPESYKKIQQVLDGDTEYNFQLKEKINLALIKHIENSEISGTEFSSSKLKSAQGKFGVQNDSTLYQRIDTAAKSGKPVSLIFLDLDNFKSVNDDYEHTTGDLVIKQTLELIQDVIHEKGELFHRGGDEIVVLLKNSAEIEGVATAERIRAAIASYEYPKIGRGFVTASIGVATYPDNCNAIENLEISADKALTQHAKKTGKNRVVIFKD